MTCPVPDYETNPLMNRANSSNMICVLLLQEIDVHFDHWKNFYAPDFFSYVEQIRAQAKFQRKYAYEY